jgi:hypothetical protein
MVYRSAFHLDCTALLPDCRFACARCLQEVRSIFTQIPGVDGLYTEGQGTDARLIIVHDPSRITAEQMMDILKRLPSFHKAFFAPAVLG